MSLYLGTQRVAGHNQTISPDEITNFTVSFNDDGNIEGYDSYEQISSEMSDNSQIGSLFSAFKRGGNIFQMR